MGTAVLFLAALLLALVQGCARDTGRFQIRGRIVDAETGAPVSREHVLVHLFNDSVKAQTSIGMNGDSRFEARMPESALRLRVFDPTSEYRTFERELEVPSAGLDYVVELVPTHFVLVKGRLLENGKPPHVEEGVIGGTPMLGFAWDSGFVWDYGCASADYSMEDGSFEVRLPRTRVEVQMIDTGLGPVPKFLDLTGVSADSVVQDIRLSPE